VKAFVYDKDKWFREMQDPARTAEGKYRLSTVGINPDDVVFIVQDNAGNSKLVSATGIDGLRAIHEAFPVPEPLRQRQSQQPSGGGQRSASQCNYPKHIISLFVYDGNVPGDKERLEKIAKQNLADAGGWFDSAITDVFNPQLAGEGYEQFGISPNVPGEVAGYDVKEIVSELVPFYPIRNATGDIVGTGINYDNASDLKYTFFKRPDEELIFVFVEIKSSIMCNKPVVFAAVKDGYISMY